MEKILQYSAIICDEVIESYEKETNFNEKKGICKIQNFFILLFLLIAIALLIAASIYCYLIKYLAKRKHCLPFHDTKLKQVHINNMNLKLVIKSKI